jgi:hypothetical protein
MIDFIFTLDYEVYGNGSGSLKELVFQPAEALRTIFKRWDAPFVNYVEVAEFDKIEGAGTDPAIDQVTRQIRDLHREGHEIALHLHPQWYNAQYQQGRWLLDDSEYNLCVLPPVRIAQIVDRSLEYLRHVLDESDFTPFSFRAGNWLFQPTKQASQILYERGMRLDSSVYKGGLQHNNGLDYRGALANGYYWTFADDAARFDPNGQWLELPIYTELVPAWKMATGKRLRMNNSIGMAGRSHGYKWNRLRDFMRFRYPLKLDFCRMTLEELLSVMHRIVAADRDEPGVYKPIVAIGHTKDLADPRTVGAFLAFLRGKKIPIVTFEGIRSKLYSGLRRTIPVTTQPAEVTAGGNTD